DVSVLRPAPPSEPGAGLPAEAGVVPSSREEADPVAELRAVAGGPPHRHLGRFSAHRRPWGQPAATEGYDGFRG
ncbi:hypothetical protein AB1484_31530, partial [Parafrankia sp. FMc6]